MVVTARTVDLRGMATLLLLISPPRTLRAVGGGSAAGPSHSRHLACALQSGWCILDARQRAVSLAASGKCARKFCLAFGRHESQHSLPGRALSKPFRHMSAFDALTSAFGVKTDMRRSLCNVSF